MDFQTLWPDVVGTWGFEESSGSSHAGPSQTQGACWAEQTVCVYPDVDIFKQLDFLFFSAPQPHPHPSQQMDNRKQPKLLNFSLIFPSLAN